MIATLLSLFSGIGGQIVGWAAAAAGLVAAFFAIRQSGVNAANNEQKIQELQSEVKDRATVDQITADVSKPGAPSAADQLRKQFSRD